MKPKTKIELDFDDEMTAAIVAGKKCCTFRRTQHGIVGDRFDVAGKTYRIVRIQPVFLRDAIPQYYVAEGFASPAAMQAWFDEHYDPARMDRLGYVHFFAPLQPQTEPQTKPQIIPVKFYNRTDKMNMR